MEQNPTIINALVGIQRWFVKMWCCALRVVCFVFFFRYIAAPLYRGTVPSSSVWGVSVESVNMRNFFLAVAEGWFISVFCLFICFSMVGNSDFLWLILVFFFYSSSTFLFLFSHCSIWADLRPWFQNKSTSIPPGDDPRLQDGMLSVKADENRSSAFIPASSKLDLMSQNALWL